MKTIKPQKVVEPLKFVRRLCSCPSQPRQCAKRSAAATCGMNATVRSTIPTASAKAALAQAKDTTRRAGCGACACGRPVPPSAVLRGLAPAALLAGSMGREGWVWGRIWGTARQRNVPKIKISFCFPQPLMFQLHSVSQNRWRRVERPLLHLVARQHKCARLRALLLQGALPRQLGAVQLSRIPLGTTHTQKLYFCFVSFLLTTQVIKRLHGSQRRTTLWVAPPRPGGPGGGPGVE